MKNKKLEEGQAIIEKCSRCGRKINQVVSVKNKYIFPKCCTPQMIANKYWEGRKNAN